MRASTSTALPGYDDDDEEEEGIVRENGDVQMQDDDEDLNIGTSNAIILHECGMTYLGHLECPLTM